MRHPKPRGKGHCPPVMRRHEAARSPWLWGSEVGVQVGLPDWGVGSEHGDIPQPNHAVRGQGQQVGTPVGCCEANLR